jgi:hypothetical protein
MANAKQKFISNKIQKIEREGVRKNTHASVSKSNPRRPVGVKQAAAIAYSMAKRGKTSE